MHTHTVSHAKSVRSFDGNEIYYEVGKGHTDSYLVFLHGLGGDLTAWSKERVALQKFGYSTIAVDLRGHGLSDRPINEEAYNLDRFALDIVWVLRKEKVKKAIIIGHCFGGMVALHLEGKFPKTADALILVDTSYKPPHFARAVTNYKLLEKIAGLVANHMPSIGIGGHANFNRFVGTKDFDVRRIFSDILHTSLKSYLLICEQLLDYDATELLRKIMVPTLIIEGTKDSIFPPKVAEVLAHRIKKAHIELIPGANHIIVINNPKDLVEEIHKFLKKTHFPSNAN